MPGFNRLWFTVDPVHDLEWVPSRMETIPNEHNLNGHHPEWRDPEWIRSRMNTIQNGHDPEWT